MQVDAFVFHRPPSALNEDVVQVGALAVHRNADAGLAQAVCPGERCELGALHTLLKIKQKFEPDQSVCVDAR